ncbi:glucoamylase [Kitasatospora sp. NE20-6]|uniref:glycoside hydrolase family 15 protein n=1 Tax=Kitasatospora sp. NE20-6 TaxID=2859066 RepID=UPI0034DC982C
MPTTPNQAATPASPDCASTDLPAWRSPRLEDLAHLGDLRASVHIDPHGRVLWGAGPRPDSPAIFAALLGTPAHGHWSVQPATGPTLAVQHTYDPDGAPVLVQEWATEGGRLRVTSFMPPYTTSDTAGPRLIRIAEALEGQVQVRSVLAPRPDYGATVPLMAPSLDQEGTHRRFVAPAGPAALVLDVHHPATAGVNEEPARVAAATAVTDLVLKQGEQLTLSLTWHGEHHSSQPLPDPYAELARTRAFWTAWTTTLTARGPYAREAIAAAVQIKALTYAPTGAIIAAPTTSLPEEIGGERNWDYRYCWPRDAALMCMTLLRLGRTAEVEDWLRWLARAVGADARQMRVIYRVDGTHDLTEQTLNHLTGYANSTPVRIGNGAAGQLQLDVYGEVLDLIWHAHQAGIPLTRPVTALWTQLVTHLEELWEQPDAGIWEVRGPQRHFVHSKVMCWVALDRAVRLAQAGAASVPQETVARWAATRDAVHAQVCEQGYDGERNTFTQYYGGADLDAALLLLPRMGFLPPDDKRVIGTIEAVQRELTTTGGFLLRYPGAGRHGEHQVDGLAGHEGAFLLCGFWEVDALAMIGRREEAITRFERLLALRGTTGLLAEEWDSAAGRLLGNLPQGFTLAALADTALLLADLTSRAALPSQRTPADAKTGVGATHQVVALS